VFVQQGRDSGDRLRHLARGVPDHQKCPELLTAIKREVDRDRRPGRFLLSGSANLALLKGISESLAGRALYLTLHPFTQREIRGELDEQPVIKTVFERSELPPGLPARSLEPSAARTGGLPVVCLGQVRDAGVWFKGYEQTYLERDVRELSRLGDYVAFRRRLRLAALRTAQILNASELARDANMNARTVGRHLSLLEASFVITRLPPFLANRASRLIKSPKLHVTDSGLAAYLCGVQDLEQSTLAGALLETHVAQNLQAILEAHWPEAALMFWHVQGRSEVDFVIQSGHDCLAVGVKSSRRWQRRDLAGLSAFLNQTPRCRAAVLAYQGEQVARLGDRLWAVPLGTLLS